MSTCAQLLGARAPKILEDKKTVQNSARFRTTSDFDGEYLRGGERYRQAVNGVIPPTFGENSDELWSTNKKSLRG